MFDTQSMPLTYVDHVKPADTFLFRFPKTHYHNTILEAIKHHLWHQPTCTKSRGIAVMTIWHCKKHQGRYLVFSILTLM